MFVVVDIWESQPMVPGGEPAIWSYTAGAFNGYFKADRLRTWIIARKGLYTLDGEDVRTRYGRFVTSTIQWVPSFETNFPLEHPEHHAVREALRIDQKGWVECPKTSQ